jgi:Zn-dependent M28 family amino/carboxypeptidase
MVQEIIDQVDLPRLMFYANEVSGQTATTINGQPYTITTRNTYSGTPVTQATNYMIERLQRLGLTVTTQTWSAGRPPNVIAEKPGLNPAAGIYIICAHLDDMPGSGLAPGADDNGSGSVAVLQAAEILTPYNFNATLRFVLFTGEEQGLLGSAAYANLVQNQDIRGVLNMDMIAWDGQGGPDMDLHAKSTVAGSMALAQIFADVVSAYQLNLTPVVYSNGTTASDHASFWNVGIPAFLVIENYRSDGGTPADFNAYYHSADDRTLHFDQPYFHDMARASVASFAHMASLRTDCYWADLNCDETVDASDLTRAASHWSTSAGQWNYSRVYDVDDNGVVDVVDIQQFAAAWGWISPG